MTDSEKHTGVRRGVDKAEDMTAAAVGKAAAAAGGGGTEAFVKNAAQGDMYEIQAAEIATRRTKSDTVRALAEEMISDHRAASQGLQQAVKSSGLSDVQPPAELDARRKGMIENLEAAPDGDFDKSYIDQQYAAHDEATTLFKRYRDHGDNPALQSFAAETLPVLERHFEHVGTVRERM